MYNKGCKKKGWKNKILRMLLALSIFCDNKVYFYRDKALFRVCDSSIIISHNRRVENFLWLQFWSVKEGSSRVREECWSICEIVQRIVRETEKRTMEVENEWVAINSGVVCVFYLAISVHPIYCSFYSLFPLLSWCRPNRRATRIEFHTIRIVGFTLILNAHAILRRWTHLA